MIKNDKLKIKVANKNYKLYKQKYDCSIGDEIEIKISDLPLNSRKIVDVICDNCDAEKSIKYCDYIKVYNKKNKYYCSKCRNVSIKDGVKDKYGVENVFQLQETKDKTKKTNIKLYGFEHHLQNVDILEKQKETNQKRYGVDFIPQLKKYTTIDFVKMCNKKHKNKYTYNNANYLGMEQKIMITCEKHDDFFQRAVDHYRGLGCPKCATSKGEDFIINYLNDRNIVYNYQKTFDGCIYKNKLPFDFYIPSINLLIEYDGEQHYMIVENWGGEKEFKLRQKKDRIKNRFCKENSIKLERIKYDEDLEERLNLIFNI